MALSFTKKQMARIEAALEGDYETLEEAARAVMAEALSVIEERASWTVVGQLRYTPDGGWMGHDDARATKMSLGWYATETVADKAAQSLAASSITGEEFRTWTLPVHHGSPATFFTERRKAEEARIAKMDESERGQAERALQRRIDWVTRYNGTPFPEDIDDERDRCGRCGQVLPEEEGATHE